LWGGRQTWLKKHKHPPNLCWRGCAIIHQVQRRSTSLFHKCHDSNISKGFSKTFQFNPFMAKYWEKIKGPFPAFQLKICDLWENGKSYDLAICRDNSVYQTIFNGSKTIN
jgi:hypothetical protein